MMTNKVKPANGMPVRILATSSARPPLLNVCGNSVKDVFDDSETKLTNFPVLTSDNKTAGIGKIGTFAGRVE